MTSENPSRAEITMDEIISMSVRTILLHEEAQRQQRTQPSIHIKNSELSALLPKFKGQEDDGDLWIQRVDAIQESYEVRDEVIKLVAVGKLTGQAQRWYYSKVDFIRMPWDELKTEFKSMFVSRPNKVLLMKKFESRRWRRTEKFSNYFSDKVLLGNQAGVGEELMLEYIIDGFENPTLQSQARMQEFASTADLLRVMKNVTNEDRATVASNTNYAPKRATMPNRTEGAATTAGVSTMRCFNCNMVGQRAAECRKAKRNPGTCFICASASHQARECPQRKRPAEITSAPADSTTHLVAHGTVLNPALTLPISLKLRPEDKYKILLDALVDGGSPISLLRCDIVPDIQCEKAQPNEYFQGVNASPIVIKGTMTRAVTIAGVEMTIKFFVVPENTINQPCLKPIN